MIQESAYRENLKSCSSFNARIGRERGNKKVPFLDAQTRIAQKPGHLWHMPEERQMGNKPDQVFSYPARRWKKKKRDAPMVPPDVRCGYIKPEPPPTHFMSLPPSLPERLHPPMMEMSMGVPLKTSMAMSEEAPMVSQAEPHWPPPHHPDSRPAYKEPITYLEYDELSDTPDEMDYSDGDDYEEPKKKKGSKKKTQSGAPYTLGKDGKKRYFGGAAAALIPLEEKPYCCLHCQARYKSKPGLNYHLAHVHSDFGGIQNQQRAADSAAASGSAQSRDNLVEGASQPINICDFCLGDASENKQTGQSEILISCHDCGRSGHPTCLKFTRNMIISTKKYGWQCIECKSCAICGTSENDDQLLFCDDCDRGFHLYCLNPPLAAAPQGDWSCHLCQVEFRQHASRPAPQFCIPNPMTGKPPGM